MLSNPLTAGLEAALAGQGATPDPDTGLVHLGADLIVGGIWQLGSDLLTHPEF